MRAKRWTIVSTVATVVVLAIAALYGLAAVGLEERQYVCRGYATSPASSEVVGEQGRLQISEYAPFVQSLARFLREDIVGEAEAVFISDLTGVVAEHQITASGSAGARTYNKSKKFSQKASSIPCSLANCVDYGDISIALTSTPFCCKILA